MTRTSLQLAVVCILITFCGAWHLIAREIVAAGFGSWAIIAIFAALPFLSRYLD